MIASVFGSAGAIEVPCLVEVERTRETLFAHVALDGLEVAEGDVVTVQSAPRHVAFGSRVECESVARVVRAGSLERFWVRLASYLELTELYEVGFQAKE